VLNKQEYSSKSDHSVICGLFNSLTYSPVVKMESVRSSETSVKFSKDTPRHISKDSTLRSTYVVR
jgi:hypothetical protein